MTKKQLFKLYRIENLTLFSHWTANDKHYSIELYRLMHDGALPKDGDTSFLHVLEFLDKASKDIVWLHSIEDWGSLWLTAKRMVYKFSDMILEELNERKGEVNNE